MTIEKIKKTYNINFPVNEKVDVSQYNIKNSKGKRIRNILFDGQEYKIFYDKSAEGYYTNSTNLPVNFTTDVWSALKHQEALLEKYTGGCVFHTFLGESVDDWHKVADYVKNVMTNTKVPYITVSPSYSICEKHGYIRGATSVCPKCRDEQLAAYQKELDRLEAKKQELFSK